MENPKDSLNKWQEEQKIKEEEKIKGIKSDLKWEASSYMPSKEEIKTSESETLFNMAAYGILEENELDEAVSLTEKERQLMRILNKFADETMSMQAQGEYSAPYYARYDHKGDISEEEGKLLSLHSKRIEEIEKEYLAKIQEEKKYMRYTDLERRSVEELAHLMLTQNLNLKLFYTEERFMKQDLPQLFEYGEDKKSGSLNPYEIFDRFFSGAARRRISSQAFRDFYKNEYPRFGKYQKNE